MRLKPQSPQPILLYTKVLVGPLLDEDTVYRLVGDVLFTQFRDEYFANLYPASSPASRPSYSPLCYSCRK